MQKEVLTYFIKMKSVALVAFLLLAFSIMFKCLMYLFKKIGGITSDIGKTSNEAAF